MEDVACSTQDWPQKATAIMAKRDVHVLKRIDKQDRRADRATRKLMRKLARTQRNQRVANYPVLCSPSFNSMSFASATNLIFREEMVVAKKRLARARDSDGKRAFYVAEVFEVDNEPLNLLVIPRTSDATPQLCGQAATKDPESNPRVSTSTVTLLEASNAASFDVAGAPTLKLLVQKVHIENGLSIFYGTARALPTQTCSDPWSLGLDSRTTSELQRVAARLLGAQLVCAKPLS